MVRLQGWSTVVVLMIASAATSALGHPLQGPYRDGNRLLATRPALAEGIVNDVRGHAANGRLWVSRGHIGDPQGRFAKEFPLAWGSPGPAGYGAYEDDFSQVKVRVGQTAVAINPWESIPQVGYERLERGRELWLRENGFTGGVRTFTNPAHRRAGRASVASATPTALPEPRMIIDLPADMPRFKKRQEVDARPVRGGQPGERSTAIVVVRTADQPAAMPVIDAHHAAKVTVREVAPKTREGVKVAEAHGTKDGEKAGQKVREKTPS